MREQFEVDVNLVVYFRLIASLDLVSVHVFMNLQITVQFELIPANSSVIPARNLMQNRSPQTYML